MKMQKMVSAVLLLMVTAIAFNVLAVPVQAKHVMDVNMWGYIYFGFDEVREIPTGTWAAIAWGWGCLTWEQVDDFLDSVDLTWTIDGEPILDYEIRYFENGLKVAWFVCYWHPHAPGEYDVELTVTFTKDHFDGFDDFLAGTVIYAPRTILVTPRGLYPLDPPEEPA